MALPHPGTVSWSAVCDCDIFPDHTHLLFVNFRQLDLIDQHVTYLPLSSVHKLFQAFRGKRSGWNVYTFF